MTFSIDGVPKTVPIVLIPNGLGATGSASFSTSTLAAGTHRITAHYDGMGSTLPSDSRPVTPVIAPSSTATVLIARPNPSAGGQAVIFTAGVASITGAVPTGELTFFIDGVGHTAPLAPAAGVTPPRRRSPSPPSRSARTRSRPTTTGAPTSPRTPRRPSPRSSTGRRP